MGGALSTFLFLCPSHRDYREIALLDPAGDHQFLFHDYASIELEQMLAPLPEAFEIADIEQEIERIVSKYHGMDIDGVISTDDYPGSTLASIVAERFRLPGVPPCADLLCQHKYHARVAQRVAAPQAVPEFELLNSECRSKNLHFPFFIKPVKSFFSIGAYRIADEPSLRQLGKLGTLPECFFAPFRILFEKYTGLDFGLSRVLAETLLEGQQATFEGYIYAGKLYTTGVVDSIMYPGKLAFQRFQYPSSLPESVQTKIAEIAAAVMLEIGINNGIFNIEFMYNEHRDTIHIIEINPRMASQFADLFEKVDGLNTYSILLDLALGRQPAVKRRQGRYKVAASCVLRLFEDRHILKVPTTAQIALLLKKFPDARVEILASEGKKLSQQLQDGQSYRYGVVSIGGRDISDIQSTLEQFHDELPFVMERIGLLRERVSQHSG